MIPNNKKTIVLLITFSLVLRIIMLVSLKNTDKNNEIDQDKEYGLIAKSLLKGMGYSLPIVDASWEKKKYQKDIDNRKKSTLINQKINDEQNKIIIFKETGKYRPSANQLPFYPLLIKFVYYFINHPFSFWLIKIVQAFFSSITTVVIYLITQKIFNKKAAAIAGIISCAYPVFIIYAIKIFPETFFTFFLALSVYSLLLLKESPSIKNCIVVGIMIGITILNSNVIVPEIPLIALWLFLMSGAWKEKFIRTLLTMVTLLVIISPWLIRNYLIFNEFPLLKSTMGVNLWLGNNKNATGTYYLPSGEPMDTILPSAFYQGLSLSETKQDKLLYDDVMTYLKKEPKHFIRLFFKRIYYFLWFPPDNIISRDVKIYKNIFYFPYGILLFSCLLGILVSWKKNPKDVFLLFSIIASVTLLFSVFHVGHLRYRMPIEPYIIIFSSYTIDVLSDKLVFNPYRRRKNQKPEPLE